MGGTILTALLAAINVAGQTTPVGSAPQASPVIWTTLGTQGGPIPSKTRFQPANALSVGRRTILVDVGDGAADQLARAAIPLASVDAVFISHLHFDHTAGLQAVLGMRYQTDIPGVLTIYGPPGTKALVDGLIASMAPAAAEGLGLPVPKTRAPSDGVRVIELTDGGTAMVDGVAVRAAENTHYSIPAGASRPRGVSLAFRFDAPGRSIAYSGDTGPSVAVERLAHGADLLVAEMADVDAFRDGLSRSMPNLPPPAVAGIVRQMREHHLTPDQLGELAGHAEAKALVVTHLIPGDLTTAALDADRQVISAHYSGRVSIATDLARY